MQNLKTARALMHLLVLVGLVTGLGLSAAPAEAANPPQVPASFTLSGAGWGHGIGMSQYGARGMALEKVDGKNKYTANDIVKHYYTGATVSYVADKLNLRAGLIQDATKVYFMSDALTTGGGVISLILYDGVDQDHLTKKLTKTVQPGKQISVKRSNDQSTMNVAVDGNDIGSGARVTLQWNRSTRTTELGTVKVAQKPLDGSCSSYCWTKYKYGYLDIQFGAFGDSTPDINVVNQLRLSDEYLYGLGEMPSSWPQAALQAQVMAARSYALVKYNGGKKARCLCHINTSDNDQVFVGYSKEVGTWGAEWKKAVDATRKSATSALPANQRLWKAITYNGEPIAAYFSSSTGGKTQPTDEVWGGNLPWAKSVDDHWSTDSATENPNSHWTHTIQQRDLIKLLKDVGVSVLDVASFSVSARYSSDAVKEFRVVDSAGNIKTFTVMPRIKAAGRLNNISPDSFRGTFDMNSTYISQVTASTDTVAGSSNTSQPAIESLTVTPIGVTRITNARTLNITGSITPALAKTAVLLYEKVKDKWVVAAKTTTTESSAFILQWKPAKVGSHRFKVVAKNSSSRKQTASATIEVVGSVKMSAPTEVKHHTTIQLTGTVSPVLRNVVIIIQRKNSHNQWVDLIASKSTSRGTWSVKLPTLVTAGTDTLRAKTDDVRVGSVGSKPVTITVK